MTDQISDEAQSVPAKVTELTPESKRVNVLARVVSVGEAKEIPARFGPTRRVAEAILGDETGVITISLWQEQIGTIAAGETIQIENGFVSLVRGRMHLTVGKYGTIKKADAPLEVNTAVDMSQKEYPMPQKSYGGRRNDRF
jgi:replication factor A1